MIKKLIFSAAAILTLPVMFAYAATPALSVTGSGNSDASIQVSGGEINSPVMLYFFNPKTGLYQGYSLGSTNASGTLSSTINTGVIGNLGANLGVPVYVQVGGYESSRVMWPYSSFTSNGSSSVMFNNSYPTMSVGQNGTVLLSGGNGGTYYIASNSNASGITPTISGNVLSLQGNASGQANIMVCSTAGGCGMVTASVSGSSNPTLSQSSLNFMQGNQGAVAITNGTGPFTVQIPSGSGITTTLTGNALHVMGNATGTTVINVCSSNYSSTSNTSSTNQACTPLTVNVQAQANASANGNGNNNSNGTTTGVNTLATRFSSTIPLMVGQTLSFDLGNDGQFFVQSPVNGSVLASVNTGSGNRLLINGSMAGNGTFNVCQNGGSCFPVNFVVSPAVQATTDTSSNTSGLTGTGGGTIVLVDLEKGARGPDVIDLQTRLSEEGYLKSSLVTGYFGDLTLAAVIRYQRAHNIPATGFVGTMTRAELNR